MPIEILMPALSPTMTEGTLATWSKQEGDTVSAGDVIAEIETDKATMEFEAVDEGVLGKILVAPGTQGIAVNTPIALLLEEGEDASALDTYGAGGNGQAVSNATPAPDPAPASVPAPPASEAAPVSSGPAPKPQAGANGRVFASPLARRLAGEAGLDLGAIAGSGPRGRVIKRDVEAALAAGTGKAAVKPSEPAAAAPAAPQAKAAPAAPSGPDAKVLADAYGIPYREVANSNMRKTIARRLLEAKQTIPHFYLTVDVALDALLKLRRDLNARSEADGIKLSVNDFLIKAAALTLRKVPRANAAWTDQAMLMFDRVDVSVAVATDEGLITPIIKDADRKGLATISAEMKDLAARARDGKLKLEEFQGGTFSISNLGMYGTREFSAIINPPQVAILAIGAGEQRPVVRDGALAVGTVMSCTLSSDHRVVDGAVAADFMSTFKKVVEDPIAMML